MYEAEGKNDFEIKKDDYISSKIIVPDFSAIKNRKPGKPRIQDESQICSLCDYCWGKYTADDSGLNYCHNRDSLKYRKRVDGTSSCPLFLRKEGG